jgi:hypothetical protein
LTERLYEHFLHRDIDASSQNALVAALEHGVPEEAIIAGIVGSDEYLAVRT